MVPPSGTASPPAASRLQLLCGAGALGWLSFLMSGNSTSLPQLFFQRHDPANKLILLSACLLVGTVAATLGVLSASRRAPLGVGAAALGVLVVGAASLGLFGVRSAAGFMALTVVMQLGDNHLVARIDRAAVARAGASGRGFNDAAGNGARLLGMLAAPAFFPALYDRTGVMLLVLGVVAAVGLGGAVALLEAPTAPATATEMASATAGGEATPLGRRDRLLFGYVIAVYASLYLFAANLIYLLRDVQQLEQAERRGGHNVLAVFLAALAINVALPWLRRGRGEFDRPRVAPLVAPALALGGAALGLLSGVRVAPSLLLVGSAVVGLAYGAFLLEVRGYASRGARLEGKGGLLTLFNNMANLSALGAFAVMLLLALARSGSGGYAPTLLLIGGLPLAGLPLLALALRGDPGAAVAATR